MSGREKMGELGRAEWDGSSGVSKPAFGVEQFRCFKDSCGNAKSAQ